MMSVKLDKSIQSLSQNYIPFNMLSSERLAEIVNKVRFIEMHPCEIFQIQGGNGLDYLFLIEGAIDIIQEGVIKSISDPLETSKRPILLPPNPKTCSIVARDNSIICHADREMLDNLISWDEIVHQLEDAGNVLAKQLDLVRNSLIFRRLPLEAVEIAFQRMQEINVKKDDHIIELGEEGDSYYIIIEGTAEVFRTGPYDDNLQKIVDLSEGDTFGSEALISGKKRAETVRMTSDGRLLVLNKKDFQELISTPLIKTVHPKVAKTMLETGYKLVDVRYQEEFKEHHIPNTTLIPLNELRHRYHELNRNEKYIIYCHSGNRSAVAALFLTEHHFDAASLEGGIREWPFDTICVYQE